MEIKFDEHGRKIDHEDLEEIKQFGFNINKTVDYVYSCIVSLYRCFNELYFFLKDFYKYNMEIDYDDELFKEE